MRILMSIIQLKTESKWRSFNALLLENYSSRGLIGERIFNLLEGKYPMLVNNVWERKK